MSQATDNEKELDKMSKQLNELQLDSAAKKISKVNHTNYLLSISPTLFQCYKDLETAKKALQSFQDLVLVHLHTLTTNSILTHKEYQEIIASSLNISTKTVRTATVKELSIENEIAKLQNALKVVQSLEKEFKNELAAAQKTSPKKD